MKKIIRVAIVLIAVYFFISLTNNAYSPGTEEWFNASYHYRIYIEINNTVERYDWPIDQEINFTYMMQNLNSSGSFDENSTRLFEYNSTGGLLYEVPSQIEKSENYNASSNAVANLIFSLNGSVPADTLRYFFLYFDTIENGNKTLQTYSTDLDLGYDINYEIISVNNSKFEFWFDTVRGENTSGLYRVRDRWGSIILLSTDAQKTAEYIEYKNGTQNLTFDLRNNASFLEGPVKVRITQKGNETFWFDSDNQTGEANITKTYHIYENSSWIRIEQNITNIANHSITRSSNNSGALAIDLDKFTFPPVTSANTTDPHSWSWVRANDGSIHVGVVNENESVTNFTALNASGRVGINLTDVVIPENGSIYISTVIHFNGTQAFDTSQSEAFKNQLSNPPLIDLQAEAWTITLNASTNSSIFNRGETLLLTSNITSDSFNLTNSINASLDMGTADPIDNIVIMLYDDGSHGDLISGDRVYTNTYNITENDTIGTWHFNTTAYDIEGYLLNLTSNTFNITPQYNVNISILNPPFLVNEHINTSIIISNYRNDTNVSGCNITCNVNGTGADNITDYNNGSYLLEFIAPTNPGIYYLSCNVTGHNNTGTVGDVFTAETPVTYMDIYMNPANFTAPNITQNSTESLEISANTTNIGNATARYVNFTLDIPANWTSNISNYSCQTVNITDYCRKSFNITIANKTTPALYFVNLTVAWYNPNTSIYTNTTQLTVNITSNPEINITETAIVNTVAEGSEKYVGNFTIFSYGNDELQNITYNTTGLGNFNITFVPENYSNISAGLYRSVQVNVSVPEGTSPGQYNGTIVVNTTNAVNDTLDINISVPFTTNISVISNLSEYISTGIEQNESDTFDININATNVGEAVARYVNISLSLPNINWSSNTSFEECGTLNMSDVCRKSFNITIPNKTTPGNYSLNVTIEWINPNSEELTNQTNITINVTSNPKVITIESNISNNAGDGLETYVDNFTIFSQGNDIIYNISYDVSGLDNFSIDMLPSNISSISAGSNYSVSVNVTVPLGHAPGQYFGNITINTTNDGYYNLTLNVTVPPNRTWNMSPQYCEKAESPLSGTACNVTVQNRGNIYTNFTIINLTVNHTNPNVTNFSVAANSSFNFSILYNVTGQPPNFYNSSYMIDTIESGASPDNITLNITLTPYANPIVAVNASSNSIPQNEIITFSINITDLSTTGINFTRVNVTRPGNITETFVVTPVNINGNPTFWNFTYPNLSAPVTGNTSLRGIYNLTFYTEDNTGTPGNENISFVVYANLVDTLLTFDTNYFQGDVASIFYRLKDINNNPLPNANVTLTINGPDGNITYNQTHQTNNDGVIPPPIQFTIPSDSILGNYSLNSSAFFFDDVVNYTLNKTSNSTFSVMEVSGGGLFGEVETVVVWYPDNVMKFAFLIYDGSGSPITPNDMNFTVYDPADNYYFSIPMSNMTEESVGFYTYNYAMPTSTATGYYLGVLNISWAGFETNAFKAFRVSAGGPFDLRLSLLEQNVPRGDYLDFEVTIMNMGEVSLDVVLELWTTFNTGSYYYSSETLLSPGNTNLTISRNAYIYSDQPLGYNNINARLTYDSIKPPVTSSQTFMVTEVPVTPEEEEEPSGPSGGEEEEEPEAEPTPKHKITISDYPRQINLVKGWTDFASVAVANSGEGTLSDVNLILTGIPSPWYTIDPSSVDILTEGSTTIFLIEFNIPRSVEAKEYDLTIIANSDQDREQTLTKLTVFESQKDLLFSDLNRLKQELQEIIEEIDFAEASGKDIKNSRELVEEIRNQISLAEENLADDQIDDATDNLVTGFNLIDRIKKILREAEFRVEYRIQTIPLEYILLIIFILVLVNVIIIVWIKGLHKGLGRRFKPQIIKFTHIIESIRGQPEPKNVIIEEHDKTIRMLKLLEKEYRDGIISESSYNELKKKAEKNLNELKKKL